MRSSSRAERNQLTEVDFKKVNQRKNMSAKPKRSEENKPSHKHPRKKRQRQEHDLANHYGATLMRAVLLSTIAAVLRRISQSSEDDGAKIRIAPIRVCPRVLPGSASADATAAMAAKRKTLTPPQAVSRLSPLSGPVD